MFLTLQLAAFFKIYTGLILFTTTIILFNANNMRKIILLFILILSIKTSIYAQYNALENNVWAFGTNAGVTFASGSPAGISTAINTSEGCASVSDATGSLLFYTDGKKIWNRSHAVMSGATSIVPFNTSSTTQGALIIPVIGIPTQYYVFSLESYTSTGRLMYCIVDMTLSSGFGDVIASTLGTSVNTGIGERMMAVAGNNCDIWLVTHKETGIDFYSYDITNSGISSPVVSSVGTFTGSRGYSIGQLKISPDRTKIASTSYNGGSFVTNGVGAELYDFNATTGVVSNVRRLDSSVCVYGADISPDNTKLYICSNSGTSGPTKLDQFDITGTSAATIMATRININTTSAACWPSIKLAPDGKIYIGSMTAASSNFLDCISSPNNSGSACGFSSHAVTLSSGTYAVYGLPNLYWTIAGGDTTTRRHDSVACIPTTTGFITIGTAITGTAYTWNDGVTTAVRNIATFGTYWVIIDNGCHKDIDTFVIKQTPMDTLSHIHDTAKCFLRFPITLNVPSGFPTYHWNDGSGTTSHVAPAPGTYWVWADDSCGNVVADSFHVTAIPADTTVKPATDSSVCIGVGSLALHATAGYASYRWSTGASTSSMSVTASGTYWVYQYINCSVVIDTFHITFIPYPTLGLGPNRQICIGDTITLSSVQPAGTLYLWNTGSSLNSMQVSATGTYWLQLYNGCYITDSVNVLVSPYPVVNLGLDTFNCLGQPVTLQSSISYSSPFYLWSDGSGASTLTVTTTNDYWLKVTVLGCSASDTVHITILYDTFNLFNGDTAICKGKVVQALLNANPAATFQWLPTAGIGVSTVASPLITPDTTAMYHVFIYMPGCPVKTDSFFIDVEPNPTVYIGGNRFVCEFDTIHINSFVSPQWYNRYTYSWSPATFLDFTNTATVVYTAGTTTQYFLTVTTPAGCKGNDSAQIIVNPGNFATISQDVDLCPHDSSLLAATGGGTYHWYPEMYLSNPASATPWVKAITNTKYTVYITSPAGCRDTMHITVTVFPAALISLEDSITLYPGESIHLSPLTNCTSFTWFPPVGLSASHVSDPVASPEISTKYLVYGTTVNGCKAVDSINVNINEESLLSVPNAFAPGTGVNNKFTVLKRGEAELNYFRIYNRWGQVMFETKNVSEGWDGTYKGAPQPFGVYVYDLQAVTSTGKIISKHGNVTLLR